MIDKLFCNWIFRIKIFLLTWGYLIRTIMLKVKIYGRVAANTCGYNVIAIIIPCHRIIGSNIYLS